MKYNAEEMSVADVGEQTEPLHTENNIILFGERIISNKQGCTLEEIADLYGCTRERVRQIEAKALAKLRRELIRRGVTPENMLPDDNETDKV